MREYTDKEVADILFRCAEKNMSSEEVQEYVLGLGIPHKQASKVLTQCIEDLLKPNGKIDHRNVETVIETMIQFGYDDYKIIEELKDFHVTPDEAKELIRIRKWRKSGDNISSFKDIETRLQHILCTKCGHDCSKLHINNRECPNCKYPMIKIWYHVMVKEGVPKFRAIDMLKASHVFTRDEVKELE